MEFFSLLLSFEKKVFDEFLTTSEIEFFSLSVEEKVCLIKDACMSIDGFSDNKDVKFATTGFYMKGHVAHFQKIKYIKCSKGGRVENVRPGYISRIKRRRNKKDKDDEDDGKDNRLPSDPHVLYLIFGMIITLILFLIMLSLIVWVMS